MAIKYPVYKPSLNGNERNYVNECIDSTWISSKGRFIEEFERGFSTFIGCKHGAAVSNGTVAIHLALLALGIKQGDEVIVPTLTYIASVNAITYVGAKAVFCDSKRDTWQMDPDDVLKKITDRTKAVLAVHLYGHPCEMDRLRDICNRHNLFLIEDCAESIGSSYQNQNTGTFGDIAAFSFFGNKTITTGEGGMVLTNNPELHERVFHLKGQGLAKDRLYWHDVIGYNYRMTNICAAIGLAQLEQIETFLEQKIQIAGWYRDNLANSVYEFHAESVSGIHTYWMCSILVKESRFREDLRTHLMKSGIETRPLFYPIHFMPMYHEDKAHFPVAEDLGSRGINLPSYPGLTKPDIDYICEAIFAFQS